MPQSFGPFDFGEDHTGIDERCRKILPTCKVILAREQEGYDALVNTYGLTNVRLAPDLVLNNRGSSPTETPNTRLWQMYGEGCEYIDEYAYCRYPEYTDKVIDGERAGVWYTEIHRKYKYPEFEGENFLTPCITWNRMSADGYKIRIFDDIIWICEYLADGLTMQGNMRFIKNPAGHGLSIREKAKFLHYPLKEKMKMWYNFYCDHTFCEEQYRISMAKCAEYIGAPLPFIWLSAVVHRMPKPVRNIMRK